MVVQQACEEEPQTVDTLDEAAVLVSWVVPCADLETVSVVPELAPILVAEARQQNREVECADPEMPLEVSDKLQLVDAAGGRTVAKEGLQE